MNSSIIGTLIGILILPFVLAGILDPPVSVESFCRSRNRRRTQSAGAILSPIFGSRSIEHAAFPADNDPDLDTLTRLLSDASTAHHAYEQTNGPDPNWPRWYAQYLMTHGIILVSSKIGME